MRHWVQHALSPLVVLFVFTWAVLFLALPCLVGEAADTAPPVPQPATAAVSTDDVPQLTEAQQEAQNLASVLLGKQEPARIPSPSSSLILRTEPPLRAGEQFYILLVSWLGFRVYLLSGQQTLASPVDGAILVSADTRSAVFTRPHDATHDAMALGVRVIK